MSLSSRVLGKIMKLPPAQSHAVKVERDLPIPMDDGEVLLADRYLPASGNGPLVLVRSPYGRKNMFGTMFGTFFAERGLQALVQSCRGTFGSGGSFDPFAERDDGLATIAWMRKQDWYPGSFATAGPSYLGIVQWAVAAEAGPELKAMAALVTSSDPYRSLYEGGSFSLQTCLTWINLVAGQEKRFALVRQPAASRRLKSLYNQLPLGELDSKVTGHVVPEWQGWLANPGGDEPYWATRRFAGGRDQVSAQVSFVGGWYDIFLPGQLRDYAALPVRVSGVTCRAGRRPRRTSLDRRVRCAMQARSWDRGGRARRHAQGAHRPVAGGTCVRQRALDQAPGVERRASKVRAQPGLRRADRHGDDA
jgi:uncharacterized protein